MLSLNFPAGDVKRHRTVQLDLHVLLHKASNFDFSINFRVRFEGQRTTGSQKTGNGDDLGRNHIHRHVHPQRPTSFSNPCRIRTLTDLSAAVVNQRGGVFESIRRDVWILDGDIGQKRDVNVGARISIVFEL